MVFPAEFYSDDKKEWSMCWFHLLMIYGYGH